MPVGLQLQKLSCNLLALSPASGAKDRLAIKACEKKLVDSKESL
jgi:hypothetical protein